MSSSDDVNDVCTVTLCRIEKIMDLQKITQCIISVETIQNFEIHKQAIETAEMNTNFSSKRHPPRRKCPHYYLLHKKAALTVSITSNNMSISAAAHGCKLLPTAVCQLRHGKLIHNNRVLIDSSSQSYFITKNGQAAEFSTVPTFMLSRQKWLRNHPFLDVIKCTDSEKPKIPIRIGREDRTKVVEEAEDFSRGDEMSSYFGLCFLSRITLFKDRTVILNRVPLPHSHFWSVARLNDASLGLKLLSPIRAYVYSSL
ncbi:hypothetical protein HZH68_009192 [Vespula germanica]|uniref:Uncharacterized protein n=1 Tax=Vespula germanica TaxID=30212 RepID=A0A834N6X9_VESGE|nr:hypothetical protein HZH68_009192 [Vespula germanica]